MIRDKYKGKAKNGNRSSLKDQHAVSAKENKLDLHDILNHAQLIESHYSETDDTSQLRNNLERVVLVDPVCDLVECRKATSARASDSLRDSSAYTLETIDRTSSQTHAVSSEETFDSLLSAFHYFDATVKKVFDSQNKSRIGLQVREFRQEMKDFIRQESRLLSQSRADLLRSWNSLTEDKIKIKKIAYISSVWSLVNNQTPNNAQMLVLYLLVQKNMNSLNVLAQVKTGEGKTLIIALLAAYIAIWGNERVDIVTSNRDLAMEGFLKCKSYFQKLNLTVECNCRDNLSLKQRKDVYKCDIVYGDTGTYQGDMLESEFSNLGEQQLLAATDENNKSLIGDRYFKQLASNERKPFKCVNLIVDEVKCNYLMYEFYAITYFIYAGRFYVFR